MSIYLRKHIRQCLINYWHIIALLLIILFVRFSCKIPVLFLDDSSKYFVPPQIIMNRDFFWILNTPNWSLLNRVISYYLGIIDANHLTHMIVLEKILGIISTILVYLIANKLTGGRRIVSVIAALIFSLDPALLYIEQTVMAESLFIFLNLLTSYIFLCLLTVAKTNTQKTLFAIVFAISLALTAFSKETGETWLYLILVALFVIAVVSFKRTRVYLSIFLIVFFVILLLRLPLMFYHCKQNGIFTTSPYKTANGVLGPPSIKYTSK